MDNLNLGFSENILRIIQVNESKEIILNEEIELGFDVNDDTYQKKNKEELISNFGEKLMSILKEPSQEPHSASVLIDTSQTFLNVVPIDFKEDKDNINSHILWELSNYFPETYKNFSIRYYRLNNNFFNENIDEVLLIAIDKNKIEFIKNLCNGSNLKINAVEIDQFAVEKCLKENYSDEVKDKNILVIGCKNSRLDFSLISNEKLKYYDYENIGGMSFETSLIKQMNFFNSIFNDIERVFLYGDDNASLIKNFLNEEFGNVSASFINPFNLNNDQGGNNYSKIAPLYGLALKKFS